MNTPPHSLIKHGQVPRSSKNVTQEEGIICKSSPATVLIIETETPELEISKEDTKNAFHLLPKQAKSVSGMTLGTTKKSGPPELIERRIINVGPLLSFFCSGHCGRFRLLLSGLPLSSDSRPFVRLRHLHPEAASLFPLLRWV